MLEDPWVRRTIVFTVCAIVPVTMGVLLFGLWFKEISNEEIFKIVGPILTDLAKALTTLVSVGVGVVGTKLITKGKDNNDTGS